MKASILLPCVGLVYSVSAYAGLWDLEKRQTTLATPLQPRGPPDQPPASFQNRCKNNDPKSQVDAYTGSGITSTTTTTLATTSSSSAPAGTPAQPGSLTTSSSRISTSAVSTATPPAGSPPSGSPPSGSPPSGSPPSGSPPSGSPPSGSPPSGSPPSGSPPSGSPPSGSPPSGGGTGGNGTAPTAGGLEISSWTGTDCNGTQSAISTIQNGSPRCINFPGGNSIDIQYLSPCAQAHIEFYSGTNCAGTAGSEDDEYVPYMGTQNCYDLQAPGIVPPGHASGLVSAEKCG